MPIHKISTKYRLNIENPTEKGISLEKMGKMKRKKSIASER